MNIILGPVDLVVGKIQRQRKNPTKYHLSKSRKGNSDILDRNYLFWNIFTNFNYFWGIVHFLKNAEKCHENSETEKTKAIFYRLIGKSNLCHCRPHWAGLQHQGSRHG